MVVAFPYGVSVPLATAELIDTIAECWVPVVIALTLDPFATLVFDPNHPDRSDAQRRGGGAERPSPRDVGVRKIPREDFNCTPIFNEIPGIHLLLLETLFLAEMVDAVCVSFYHARCAVRDRSIVQLKEKSYNHFQGDSVFGEEKMVSWSFAFKKGFIIMLWSILWGVAGALIALAISGGAILAVVLNPLAFTGLAGVGPGLAMFAGIIIGVLVASIGNYATIVKITLDSVEETRRTERPPLERPM